MSLLLGALLLASSAQAASILAPGYIGGTDGGPATSDPAAIWYNPAAMGGSKGVNVLVDGYASFIRIDATSTRNEGIDPNTGEAYEEALARVMVPVFMAGVTWKAIPNRLALGFGVVDGFVGGGDYTAGEPDENAPFVSHQRYAGVKSEILTIHFIPAASFTIMKGVHVGGSFKYIMDSVSGVQAADPLGTETWENDTILEIDGSGHHFGWSAGLFVNRFKYAQVGLSYVSNGSFHAEGDGKVTVPDFLLGGSPDAKITFDAPLPALLHFWVNSQVTDKLMIGAGMTYQMWGSCCSDHEGDIEIGLLSTDGDALGKDPEDKIGLPVATTNWGTRRLQDAMDIGVNAGWQANKRFWFGGRVGYNQAAVPDFAVNATNLDFDNIGVQVAARAMVTKNLTLGLNYAKFFLQERTITNSAYDVRDPEDPNYVDEYFSPELPFTANANGTYKGAADMVGMRLDLHF